MTKRLAFMISTEGKTEEELIDEIMAAQAKFLAEMEKAVAEEEKSEEKEPKKKQ